MKLLNTLLFSVAASAFPASDAAVSKFTSQDLKVPGDSPLQFCPKSHDNDKLSIEKVDIMPNPPLAGEDLMIKATGTLNETVVDGAYVLLLVKYGLIRLISTKADLCEQVENVEMKCPIEKGVVNIIKTVTLPREIPPGKYNVFADVYTKDDQPLTCLTASVTFGVHHIVNDSEPSKVHDEEESNEDL